MEIYEDEEDGGDENRITRWNNGSIER